MQTVYLTYGPEYSLPKPEPCVMAMGFFDGVHVAHQRVILEAKNIARKRKIKLAVMTFFPHPREVLSCGKEKMNYLTPLEVKINRFSKLGVDMVYVIKFDHFFAQLSPKEFIETYVTGLGVKHVVAGFDFTYGQKGKGNMKTISTDGDGRFLVTVISKLDFKGQKISSTFIRELLSNGEISGISSYLGDFYETRGKVISHHQSLMGKRSYMEVETYPYYTLPSNGLYEVEMFTEDYVCQGSAIVYSDKIKLTFNSDLENIKDRTIKLKWIRCLENIQFKQM
ncbi:cytidyltransferase [Neobacillus cucumis]|uniref:cytidyltransferase n=1 Tax=Neobacillus cucumis TaxID=1740721 RepID=UPI00203EFAAF|nr:cytidyltransferase [Neobacillus cucumis]MCM3725018.1 cytidyltransferase [Neobacillus cucumis]